MSARTLRRAAARKAAKLAKKQAALQAKVDAKFVTPLTAAATAGAPTITNHADYEKPPTLLDPYPERSVPDHLLDPIEEAHVHYHEYPLHLRTEAYFDYLEEEHAKKEAQGKEAQAANPDVKKPVSEAQLNANRANAQHSTGPKTEEGKANSSRNNFRHGLAGLTKNESFMLLCPDESKEEYDRSVAAFMDEWKPQTATELDCVLRLASRQWLRRRSIRLQNQFVNPDGSIAHWDQHAIFRRYEATHERGFNRALDDLIRLRRLRMQEQNGFESQRRKNAEHEFKIRSLQNREKLQNLAIQTAELRLKRLEAPPTPKRQAPPAPEPPKTDHKA
jgi:hypothetical protein